MNQETQIQSYVNHKNDWYFVSTIERKSSALGDHGSYNETIVWEYDMKTKKRKDYVMILDDLKGNIKTHLEVCEKIYKFGLEKSK